MVVNTASEHFYCSEKFKILYPSILYCCMCKPHHPNVIIAYRRGLQCVAYNSAVVLFFSLLFTSCNSTISASLSHYVTSTCLSPMAPNTTLEMQENMVIWHYEQSKTVVQIFKLACCSERTVYDVLWLHQAFGQVINPFVREQG